MQKDNFFDMVNKNILYIVAAVVCLLMGAGQIVLIIAEHTIYSGGVWYMLCVVWFLLAGFLIYKYISKVRQNKEETQKIEEFKKLFNIK